MMHSILDVLRGARKYLLVLAAVALIVSPGFAYAVDGETQTTETAPELLVDVRLTKTADNLTPAPGDEVTFTVTVTNQGPGEAEDVTAIDKLGTNFEFVSATPTVGSYDSVSGLWTIGAMANQAAETLTLIARIAASAEGVITNSATVSSASEDTNDSNDTDTVQLTVTITEDDDSTETPPEDLPGDEEESDDECTTDVLKKSGSHHNDDCDDEDDEDKPCVAGPDWIDQIHANSQGTLKDGSPIIDPTRTNGAKILGAADGQFWSIGKGGSISARFDGYVLDTDGNDLSFHEITNNRGPGEGSYPEEKVEVFVSPFGTEWKSIGFASGNAANGITYLDIHSTGWNWIRYVKLVDSNDWAIHDATADGFDVDAIDATLESCAFARIFKTAVYNTETGKITYTIDWEVHGTGSATVDITDVIPAGTTYVTGTVDHGGTYDNDTKTLHWDLGSKAAGTFGGVSFEVMLDSVAAANQWAKTVVYASQGKRKDGTNVLPERSNPAQVLGPAESLGALYDTPVPDGKFFSLGFTDQPATGGVVIVAFSQPVQNGPGNDLKVFEVTGGDAVNAAYPDEQAAVEVSDDLATWTNVGVVVRDGEIDLGSATSANYIRITDTSTKTSFNDETADAFDVDGIQNLHPTSNVCKVENTATLTWTVQGNDATYSQTSTATSKTIINENLCGDSLHSISGMKWNDADKDGEKDEDENGIAGFTIYIDADDNGQYDNGEVKTETGEDGAYSFANLDAGMYVLREVQKEGYTQTYPTASYFGKHVVFVSTFDVTGKNFGNYRTGSVEASGDTDGGTTTLPKGSITGVVFNDKNGSGTQDEGEEQLSDWVVYLDANDNGALDSGEVNTTTHSPYLFTGLADGSYNVRQVVQGGWEQVAPAAKHVVTITAAGAVTGKDFANQKITTGGTSGGSSGASGGSSGGSGSSNSVTPAPVPQVLGDTTTTSDPSGSSASAPTVPTPEVGGVVTELPRTGTGTLNFVFMFGIVFVVLSLFGRKIVGYKA